MSAMIRMAKAGSCSTVRSAPSAIILCSWRLARAGTLPSPKTAITCWPVVTKSPTAACTASMQWCLLAHLTTVVAVDGVYCHAPGTVTDVSIWWVSSARSDPRMAPTSG
jgi:hypothetical protein